MKHRESESIEGPSPELVEAVSRLDENACATLLKNYEGLIRAAVRQAYYLDDASNVEELQNSARWELIRSVATWKSSKGAFSSWVYGVARNVVNGFLRDQARGPEAVQFGGAPGADGESSEFDPPDPSFSETSNPEPQSPLLHAYYQVCDKLSPEDHIVLDHVLREDPHSDLGRHLGVSEAAAKMRACRLRKHLRQAILEIVGTARS